MFLNRRNLYLAAEVALLGVAVTAAVVTTHSADWHPVGLFVLLLVLTVSGGRLTVEVAGQNLSAAFIVQVLAMALLGPAPAAVIGAVEIVVDAVVRRVNWTSWINNLSTHPTFLVIGALLIRGLGFNVHTNIHAARGVTFALAVFGVFLVTNVINFVLVAVHQHIVNGRSIVNQTRHLFIPMLPGQFAAASLAALLAVAYTSAGYPVLIGLVIVIVIFQLLMVALLRSEDRAEQLAAHSARLATLQLGVLTTLVETLQMRDPRTARHVAAVARYARGLAIEMGLDEREQDLAHTAGLLHDIGKFALPDRVLHADELTNADWNLVRRHPQEGATLVGRLDGYGPVAEVILYHHEHVDGTGYPAGLIGKEIPLISRIVSVCEVYDVLTARDSYKTPRTPQEAIVELRHSAGRQLDADVVDAFITMLERGGPVTSVEGDEAVFEQELDFERRARVLSRPAKD